MANQLAGFDPVSRFQTAQSNAQLAGRNDFAMQQAQKNAPRQNALADINLQQAQAGLAAQQRQDDIGMETQRVKFLNQAGKAFAGIPTVEGRMQAAQLLQPLASKVGIDQSVFTPENLSNEGIRQLLATTEGFFKDPESLERAKLDIRSRELAQREKLAFAKPEIAGRTEELKVKGKREGGLAGLEEDVAKGKARGKGVEVRLQGFIDDGITAAETLPTIKRSLNLLDTIKTGGFAAAALAAKQRLGVEGADEGELSANLGKAILSQMRSTFGAAFTEREGDKLDRIEANFSKSAGTNKRLLNNLKTILEREARRGISAAEKAGDEFGASEIRDALNFEVGAQEPPAQNQIQEGQTATNPQTGQTITFRNGQWVGQ